MTSWSNRTMEAISTLAGSVDGAHAMTLKRHNGAPPKGERQDYEGPEVKGIRHEWVDQSGPGMAGDDYYGTVTFVLGDFHLIVEYAT